MPDALPYWRLSAFYLFYFASLGALLPYWGLYLKHLGFGAVEIGELMAVIMATKIIAPNIWGWIADHRGHRMGIVRLASLLGAVCFAGVLLDSGFWWLALVMAVFSFFWNASLPQFEATTMNHLGEDPHHYTRVRVWGSVGFIVAVAIVGDLFDRVGPDIVPLAVLLLMAGIWLSSLLAPAEDGTLAQANGQSLRGVLKRPEVMALLAGAFLLQMSHGPYYSFFSIYLAEHGYSSFLTGQLWALGVLAEVVLFMLMHRLLPRHGLRRLFLAALLLTSLRWVLIALFPGSLALLIMAQILHAASFGLYHAVAIQYIHRFFIGRHQGRGQALYSSLSFGAGGAIGALASGYAWETPGPTFTYLMAALASTLALLITWRWLREPDTVDPT